MPTYRYTARDERGNPSAGTLTAPSPEALADQLKRSGYLMTNIREAADGLNLDARLQRLRPLQADELVLFNVQLAKLIKVGIPLVTALLTLERQIAHPKLRDVVRDVARRVETGAAFSDALSAHPAIFPHLFISMVRAGEASGKLEDVLSRLALFAKRQAELRQQLVTATTYPLVLLMVGLGVIGFLLLNIIPRFIAIFLEAQVPLPLPTQLLHQCSQVLSRWWPLLAAGLAAAVWSVRAASRTPAGRRALDRRLAWVPVMGELARQAAIARLARTLEVLLSSGVSVLESLAIAETTCGHTLIAEAARRAQVSVKAGGTITQPLEASRDIPPMVAQMVHAGESSGTLDYMLAEIAEHYDERVQHQLKRVMTLIEPAFLVVMGGFVAFILASVLLPMFRMINVVR